MKLKNLGLIIAATAVSSPFAFGQFWEPDTFTVNGIVNPGNENIVGGLSAEVDITFHAATINVVVTNTSIFDSQITGFYLKTPVGQLIGLNNGDVLDPSTPVGWTLSPKLTESLEEFGGSHNINNFFGAESEIRPENELSVDAGAFSFSYLVSSLFNEADYLTLGEPIIFVRWQAVDTGGLTDAIGEGGWGPGFDPSVPEPSEVAALAMLGLGGILFARRRFTGRKK